MEEDTVQSVEPTAPDANVTEAETPEVNEAESSPAKAESKPDEAVDRVRSRIDELTKYRREAERDRDYWREQAMRQAPAPVKATEPEPVSTAKTLADFEFDEAKYQSYLFTEAEKRAVAAAERRIREQQDQEKAGRRKSEFERRESDYSKSVEDYIEVTRNPAVPINSDMAQVIAESDDGPALAYYLGKNVEIAERISQLSPLAAAREMGRIEAKLAAEREKAKEKTVSKAPAPTPKLEATTEAPSVRTTDSTGDTLSDDEWFRLEKKRLSRRK
jgi:hypothetical protein